MSSLSKLRRGRRLRSNALIDYGYVPGIPQTVEQAVVVQPRYRAAILHGVPADAQYGVSVAAFRQVVTEIDPSGIMMSAAARAPSSPYQAASEPVFTGTVTGVEPGADVTAHQQAIMNKPDDVIIQQDYTGATIGTGQYPVSLQFQRLRGNDDVTIDADWDIAALTGNLVEGSNVSIDNAALSPTRGTVTVLADGIGKISVTSTLNGAGAITQTVEVKGNRAPPPTNTSASSFSDVTSTSYAVVASGLVRTASGTTNACTANLTFNTGSPNGTSSIKGRFVVRSGSSGGPIVYTGPDVACQGNEFAASYGKSGVYPGSDGTLNISQTATGLTNGTDYYYELQIASTSTPSKGYPIHVFGTASI